MPTQTVFRFRLRAERFDELAAQHGWDSDTQAAFAIGVDRTTVTRIRRGGMQPGARFMFRAAAVLGVPIEELFVLDEKTVAF